MDLRKAPHRLCPFYDRKWELLNGYPGGTPSDPANPFGFDFYRARDGRWVMPLNPYPKIKNAVYKLLRTWPEREAVADAIAIAIAKGNAADLEKAGEEAGVVMPMLRTTEEFLREPAYEYIAQEPLIKIERIGDSEPEPLSSSADQPLSGVRALGMGHIIACAGVGRDLAQHGADVLNIWRPDELEHDATYNSANVGVRSATINPYGSEGQARIRGLLRDADIFYANRRPGYLEKIGLSAEQAAASGPASSTSASHSPVRPAHGHAASASTRPRARSAASCCWRARTVSRPGRPARRPCRTSASSTTTSSPGWPPPAPSRP